MVLVMVLVLVLVPVPVLVPMLVPMLVLEHEITGAGPQTLRTTTSVRHGPIRRG
jgi:hypothetical protein